MFIFKIDQGGLTLPTADNYLNVTEHGKVLVAYLEYMTKVHLETIVAPITVSNSRSRAR